MSAATSLLDMKVSRERLTLAVDHGPEHLRPIYRAVRDHGVSFASIDQDAGPFQPPTGKPVICLLGDDTLTPRGLAAFDRESVQRFAARCGAAVIVSCEPLPALYIAAATCAVLARRDALIVESQPEHESDWIKLIRAANPEISLLIGAVRPLGGLH